VAALNKHHGLHMNKKGQLSVEDIDGMQVLSHADLLGKSASDAV
jgi:hypothetical protein